MEVVFTNKDLECLEAEKDFSAGYPREVVSIFRRRMQFIRGAADERDFYALKSLHYEKLRGKRKQQRSMRLNKQLRLILEIRPGKTGATVVVVDIEDYH